MSDINEMAHAIRLAETLAVGVTLEEENLPLKRMFSIREALARLRIELEFAALEAGIDLIDDHAVLDDRLRRAMTAIAKSKGVEFEEDPYASLDEIEVDFSDGRIVRLKATEADVRVLIAEFEKANAKELESLSDQLKRANLALAKAKLAARQCEGFEPELRYLFATDPAIRARVREMADARQKAA